MRVGFLGECVFVFAFSVCVCVCVCVCAWVCVLCTFHPVHVS